MGKNIIPGARWCIIFLIFSLPLHSQNRFGFVDAVYEPYIDTLRSSGADWVYFYIGWHQLDTGIVGVPIDTTNDSIDIWSVDTSLLHPWMWNFSRLDDQLDKARDLNLSVVLAIWGTAKWAVDSTYYYSQNADTNKWRSYYWRCPVKHFPEFLALTDSIGDTIRIVPSVEFFGDTGRGLWYAAFDSIIRHVNEKYADVVKAWVIWPEPETNLRDNSYQSRNYWVRIDVPSGYDTLLAIPYFYPEMCSKVAQIIKSYNPSWKVIIGALNVHPDGVNYQDYPNPPNVSNIQYSLNHYSVIERYKYLMDNIPNVEDIDAIGIDFYTSVGPYYLKDGDSCGYWFTQYFGDPPYLADPVEDTGYVDNSIKILHPVRDMLDSLRAAISLAGWQGKTIWVLETGYPTTPYSPFDTTYVLPQFTLTPDSQALFLARLLKEYLKYAENDVADLEKIIVFRGKDRNGGIVVDTVPLHFDPTNFPPDTQLNDTVFYVDTLLYSWGIIGHDRINYSPKPAFYVYQNVIEGSKIPSLLSWDSKSTYGNNCQKMVVQSISSTIKKISVVYESEGKIYFTYTYSTTNGESWSDRVCINTIGGDTIYGDLPAICANSDGVFVLFRSQDSSKVYLTSSRDGYNWDRPQEIYSSGALYSINSLSLNCTDNYVDVALIVGTYYDPGKAASSYKIIYGRTTSGSYDFTWETVRNTVDPKYDVSVDLLSKQVPVISWQQNGKVYLIAKDEESKEWTDIYLISQNDIGCRHPAIDVDESDRVHVVWETSDEVHYLYADYDGAGFKIPKIDRWVIGESQGYGYPVITHYGGNIYISWSRLFDIPDTLFLDPEREVILAEFSDGQIYQNRITYTKIDSKYPSLAVSDERNLNLIWTEGEYGAYRVAYKALDLNPAALVLEPKSGEIFEPGDDVNIRWIIYPGDVRTPLRATRILLSYDGGATFSDTLYENESLNDTTVDTLNCIWRIPDTLVSSRLRIKAEVEDFDGRLSSNTTGTFESWWMASSFENATSLNQNKLIFYKDTLYTVYLKSIQSTITDNYNTFLAKRPYPVHVWSRQLVPKGGGPPVLLKSDVPSMLIVVQANDSFYMPRPETLDASPSGNQIIHRIKIDKYTNSGHTEILQEVDYGIDYLNAAVQDSNLYIVLSGGSRLILCKHLLNGDVISDFITISSDSGIKKQPFIYADYQGIIHIAWIEGGNLVYTNSMEDYLVKDTIETGLAEYPTITSAGDTIMIMYRYGDYDIRLASKAPGGDWNITTVYTGSNARVYHPYIKYGGVAVWIEKLIPSPTVPDDEKYYVKYAIRNGSIWEINELYGTEDSLYYPHFIIHSGDSTLLTVIWTEGKDKNYKVNCKDTTIEFNYVTMVLLSMKPHYKTALYAPYPNPSGSKITIRY